MTTLLGMQRDGAPIRERNESLYAVAENTQRPQERKSSFRGLISMAQAGTLKENSKSVRYSFQR